MQTVTQQKNLSLAQLLWKQVPQICKWCGTPRLFIKGNGVEQQVNQKKIPIADVAEVN